MAGSIFGQASSADSTDIRKAASDQAQFADSGSIIFVGGGLHGGGAQTPAAVVSQSNDTQLLIGGAVVVIGLLGYLAWKSA